MAPVAKTKRAIATTATSSAGASILKPNTDSAEVTRVAKPTEIASKDRRGTQDIFGYNLPSPNLRLPEACNIAALEQIVLLTQSLRSCDPFARLVQQGFDSTTLTFVINQSRTFPKYQLPNNSTCHLAKDVMRKSGHEGWTFKKHKGGRVQVVRRADNDLSLVGMKLHCEDFPDSRGYRAGSIDNIPFEALAFDVTRLPE